MNEHRKLDGNEKNTNLEFSQPTEQEEKTPTKKRVLALIGAILVLALSILYAYSIATGMIFAW